MVPGNNLRVVSIEGTDTEACCGTHCENTGQVGWIKILKTSRQGDGILRLYYVAGEKVIPIQNLENQILTDISDTWGKISQNQMVDTAKRFFNEYKRLNNVVKDNK